MNAALRLFLTGLLALSLTACRSAYYSAWEKVGVYKRDLLKERVVEARDEQKEAEVQFKDALTRLRELYAFQGGDLERTYSRLKEEYDAASAQASEVEKRIRQMETVARDLFSEWEEELEQIQSPNLRARSREQLRSTRRKYEDLHRALSRAEASMQPVLAQFRDHVLYLKHNLNAQAIAALRGESVEIQQDITRLIEEMNRSIRQANEFVETLP